MPLTFEQAHNQQEVYRANPDTLEKLGCVTLIICAGPSGAGKNYTMRRSGYPTTGTLTTRPPRPNDEQYRYYSEAEMLDMIEARQLVQYAAITETRTIYGTDIDDYQPGGVNVMDATYDSVPQLREQGFGKILPVGVLALPDEWEERLDARFADMSPHLIAGRLEEAIKSITAITNWVNRRNRLVIVSSSPFEAFNQASILDFVESGVGVSDPFVLEVGHDMLERVPILQRKYLEEGAFA